MFGMSILGAWGALASPRAAARCAVLALAALLAGCGQTGPLYLPAPAAPASASAH